MKQCRGHIVMLLLPTGKTFDGGEGLAQELSGRGLSVGVAKRLQPLDSELIPVVIERIRDSIRAKEHRIPRLQSQG
jgi:hypothetical protein